MWKEKREGAKQRGSTARFYLIILSMMTKKKDKGQSGDRVCFASLLLFFQGATIGERGGKRRGICCETRDSFTTMPTPPRRRGRREERKV